nr:decreased expression in renal and prostate cancer protein-like [Vicugna pacos]
MSAAGSLRTGLQGTPPWPGRGCCPGVVGMASRRRPGGGMGLLHTEEEAKAGGQGWPADPAAVCKVSLQAREGDSALCLSGTWGLGAGPACGSRDGPSSPVLQGPHPCRGLRHPDPMRPTPWRKARPRKRRALCDPLPAVRAGWAHVPFSRTAACLPRGHYTPQGIYEFKDLQIPRQACFLLGSDISKSGQLPAHRADPGTCGHAVSPSSGAPPGSAVGLRRPPGEHLWGPPAPEVPVSVALCAWLPPGGGRHAASFWPFPDRQKPRRLSRQWWPGVGSLGPASAAATCGRRCVRGCGAGSLPSGQAGSHPGPGSLWGGTTDTPPQAASPGWN